MSTQDPFKNAEATVKADVTIAENWVKAHWKALTASHLGTLILGWLTSHGIVALLAKL